MKKIKPELLIAGLALILVLGGIGLAFSTIHHENTKRDTVALPQLSKKVAANESEVVLHTSQGDIKIKLFDKYAPLAVKNFLTHAKDGYYNQTIFHRVMANFMIQGGDPTGTGTGGESIWRGKDKSKDSGSGFKNEISNSLYNIRGALAMANAGADTNGSQFFINQNHDNQTKQLDESQYPAKIYQAYKHGGYPSLDGQYTVFGQVIAGMAVVDKIANAKVTKADSGEASKPVNPVTLDHIDIVKKAK